jgi:hypothetical protein
MPQKPKDNKFLNLNKMITVFIIAIGDQDYKKPALEVLKDYFSSRNNFEIFILEEDGDLNAKKAHPSWLKLISHRYTKNDNFTLCWDLDLLPRSPEVDFPIKMLDNASLNMCYDTSVVLNHSKFNHNFYYNGGLIGIPVCCREFVESVYYNKAPGSYPSYEQYYLNDAIADQAYPINLLDCKYNTLYHNGELFEESDFLHYTWGCNDSSQRSELIKKHYNEYFSKNT